MEERKILFSLIVYNDKTFAFRSRKEEVKGRWSTGTSFMAALLMLMVGIDET